MKKIDQNRIHLIPIRVKEKKCFRFIEIIKIHLVIRFHGYNTQ